MIPFPSGTRALPNATQVADRWHPMENASRAFLEAVRTSMRQIRSVMGTTTVDVALLTAAERIQYEGYLRREGCDRADERCSRRLGCRRPRCRTRRRSRRLPERRTGGRMLASGRPIFTGLQARRVETISFWC